MEILDYIDAYFQQTLTETEKEEFESRCNNDKAFAEEVAFYITARQGLKNELKAQKEKLWNTEETQKREDVFFIKPFRRIADNKWIYAVAACILLAFGTYFFERPSATQSLADNYIKNNFTQLDITMDGSRDSMQNALDKYNNKQYAQALPIFKAIYKNHPDNNDALEDEGKTYLVTKNYDSALQAFTELENKKLFSNPGTFYKAITLLRRNKAGDKETAKQLLTKVRDQHLEGSKEANDWLNKF